MLAKRQPYRNQKILSAAKGEDCTMNSPWCNYNPETVVAAHSNYQEDGKGMGKKSDDLFVAFCCSGCHDWFDGRIRDGSTEADRRDAFHRAMKRTWKRLIDRGIIR